MLFLSLTVDNLGVFRGKYTFDLTPHMHNNEKHGLTIFRGHNGAGKTTIFQALMLALYGPGYFGDLTSTGGYSHFLQSRLHHSSLDNEPRSLDNESIGTALSLQYVQSGRTVEVQIERQWKKYGHTVKEYLSILKDGRPLDVNSEDYQTWIDDLVPPGIGMLCFFDAEKLDALASEEQQSKILSDTLNRLLGLDWVHSLDTDLNQFTTRKGSTRKIEALYTEGLELQVERDKIEAQISVLREELDEVNLDIGSCEDALTQQERKLAAEGGAYAARRPVLESQLHTVQKEIEHLSSQLRDLCGELLPFALVPELCLRLSKSLTFEIESHRRQIVSKLFEEKLPEIEQMLLENDVWEGLDISQNARKHLAGMLVEKLKTFGGLQAVDDHPFLHRLSEPEQHRLRRWIVQSIREVPRQVQQLGRRLRTLKKEKQRIDTDLQRAPDDEILAPIHEEIQRLRGILSGRQKRQTALIEQIGSLQFQRDEKRKELQEIIEQHDKVRKNEKQLKYAEQTRNVLRTYKDALMRQKLRTLEVTLAECFNKICRKEHLLSSVHIDPTDLSVQLKSVSGILLKLNDFSAGERQLYAMSLLWALRLVSNLPLPLAIDTPLARLDETHRLRFVHDYIPHVSDQVVLFATDAEIDTALLEEARFEVARTYQLSFDEQQGETKVICKSDFATDDRQLSLLP